VRYFVQEGIDDFDGLFDLLADLETDEAATVERLNRRAQPSDLADGTAPEPESDFSLESGTDASRRRRGQ
jgi:hypothetical protein